MPHLSFPQKFAITRDNIWKSPKRFNNDENNKKKNSFLQLTLRIMLTFPENIIVYLEKVVEWIGPNVVVKGKETKRI